MIYSSNAQLHIQLHNETRKTSEAAEKLNPPEMCSAPCVEDFIELYHGMKMYVTIQCYSE